MVSIRQILSLLALLGSLSAPAFAQPPASEGDVAFSSLKITAQPADAKILMDGKPVSLVEGVALIEKIESGVHNVAVSHPDYVEKADDITLQPNKFAVLNIQLEGKMSRIDVKSRPSGAMVLLDDRVPTYYGATTDNTPVTLMLKPGKYVLNLKKDSYKTYQQTLVVLPNRPQKLGLVLRQPKPFTKYLNYIGGAIAVSGAVTAGYGSVTDNKRLRNTGWGIGIGGFAIAAASVILD